VDRTLRYGVATYRSISPGIPESVAPYPKSVAMNRYSVAMYPFRVFQPRGRGALGRVLPYRGGEILNRYLPPPPSADATFPKVAE